MGQFGENCFPNYWNLIDTIFCNNFQWIELEQNPKVLKSHACSDKRKFSSVQLGRYSFSEVNGNVIYLTTNSNVSVCCPNMTEWNKLCTMIIGTTGWSLKKDSPFCFWVFERQILISRPIEINANFYFTWYWNS